jgi:hypothetical protein
VSLAPQIVNRDYAATQRKWPRSGDSPQTIQSLLQLDLDEMYGCQEASGNVVGLIAGTELGPTGTPVFQRQTSGRFGIYYDTDGDMHSAVDMHQFGVASGLYMCVLDPVALISASGIIGCSNGGGTESCLLFSIGTDVGFQIRDDGAGDLQRTVAADLTTLGGVWLAQLQVDRTAEVARVRWSPRGGTGSVLTDEGSIAGFSTLNGAAQSFWLGSGPLLSRGAAIQWAAVATGAQCEGATLLERNAKALGFP